jgi:hypothetical protein
MVPGPENGLLVVVVPNAHGQGPIGHAPNERIRVVQELNAGRAVAVRETVLLSFREEGVGSTDGSRKRVAGSVSRYCQAIVSGQGLFQSEKFVVGQVPGVDEDLSDIPLQLVVGAAVVRVLPAGADEDIAVIDAFPGSKVPHFPTIQAQSGVCAIGHEREHGAAGPTVGLVKRAEGERPDFAPGDVELHRPLRWGPASASENRALPVRVRTIDRDDREGLAGRETEAGRRSEAEPVVAVKAHGRVSVQDIGDAAGPGFWG